MVTRREVVNRFAFMEYKAAAWVPWVSISALLVVWEALSRSPWVSALYLPPPSAIVGAGVEMAISGELWTNLMASMGRIAAGYALGSTVGVLVGLALGFSALAEAAGNPILYSLYPVPKIALLPLIILWLGIGEVSKITIITLGVFFPVAINTYAGVKNVDPLFIKVAVSFQANRLAVLRQVVLPGALPMIFAGLKLAAGTSLLLLVAAEMIAAKEGIGALILHYGDLMLTTKLMVGVVVLSLLGVVFNQVIHALEQRVIPWKH